MNQGNSASMRTGRNEDPRPGEKKERVVLVRVISHSLSYDFGSDRQERAGVVCVACASRWPHGCGANSSGAGAQLGLAFPFSRVKWQGSGVRGREGQARAGW